MTVSGAGRGRAPDRLFILLFGGMTGGVALFCYGFVLGQKKRLVETTPTSAIRSLAVGLVEIIGTAELSGPVLLAPFSQLSCVFFSYRVEEQQGSGDHRRWKTIAEGTSDQPFGTRDATGIVQVFPQGADLMLQDARTYPTTGWAPFPSASRPGLPHSGLRAPDGWGKRHYAVMSPACCPTRRYMFSGPPRKIRRRRTASTNQDSLSDAHATASY